MAVAHACFIRDRLAMSLVLHPYISDSPGVIFLAWTLLKESGTVSWCAMLWDEFVVKQAYAKTSLESLGSVWAAAGSSCLAIYAASTGKDAFGKV